MQASVARAAWTIEAGSLQRAQTALRVQRACVYGAFHRLAAPRAPIAALRCWLRASVRGIWSVGARVAPTIKRSQVSSNFHLDIVPLSSPVGFGTHTHRERERGSMFKYTLYIYTHISMRAKPPKEAIASSAGSLGKLFRVRVRGCCVGSDGSREFRKAAHCLSRTVRLASRPHDDNRCSDRLF